MTGMNPTLGRTVHVVGYTSNGSNTHPGIVTRAWSETCVNLTLFPDNGGPLCMTSIRFEQTQPLAEAYSAQSGQPCAYWPQRV